MGVIRFGGKPHNFRLASRRTTHKQDFFRVWSLSKSENDLKRARLWTRYTSVQTLGEGEGSLAITLTGERKNDISFLGGICNEKENSFQFVVNKRYSG